MCFRSNHYKTNGNVCHTHRTPLKKVWSNNWIWWFKIGYFIYWYLYISPTAFWKSNIWTRTTKNGEIQVCSNMIKNCVFFSSSKIRIRNQEFCQISNFSSTSISKYQSYPITCFGKKIRRNRQNDEYHGNTNLCLARVQWSYALMCCLFLFCRSKKIFGFR